METAVGELLLKGKKAREASRTLSILPSQIRDQALINIADGLQARQKEILAANETDYRLARQNGLSDAILGRLFLDQERIEIIADSVRGIVALPDPVGETFDMRTLPNGLIAGKRRIPLGVIGAIFESRPNVTVDIAVLCIKSGNAVILRGGKEAVHSNAVLATLVGEAINMAGVPKEAVQHIESTDRALVGQMLNMKEYIDLIIPRGGDELVRRVASDAAMPSITGGVGVCHIYVDRAADIDKAVAIACDAKLSRPYACNALDTLLVHSDIAPVVLPKLATDWAEAGVELHLDSRTLNLLDNVNDLEAVPVTEDDWGTEFLSLKVAVKIVDTFDQALEHITAYGSGHTEAIVTEDYAVAMQFLDRVDSSVVLVNASTCFNDGAQLGLGSEVAISTNKMHVRGPVGVKDLTSYKWTVLGTGQVRG